MSLADWVKNDWLKEHQTSPREIADLLAVIDRDIRSAQMPDQDTDWKLGMAYNAVMQCANTALAASGYRATKAPRQHYYTIESLRFTLQMKKDDLDALHGYRQARHFADYERAGTISDTDAAEALAIAIKLRADLHTWLAKNYPQLLPPVKGKP